MLVENFLDVYNWQMTHVIHSIPHSKTQTTQSFICRNNTVNVLHSYKYIGLVLTDMPNLNFAPAKNYTLCE